jgi:hypothetical protein
MLFIIANTISFAFEQLSASALTIISIFLLVLSVAKLSQSRAVTSKCQNLATIASIPLTFHNLLPSFTADSTLFKILSVCFPIVHDVISAFHRLASIEVAREESLPVAGLLSELFLETE